MGEIYAAVKNLIFFLLLVTVFSNLLGKSSFKKYIHIFVGLITILIIIKPLLTWTNSLDKVDYYYDLNVYQSNARDISAQIVGTEKDYQKQVVESYKEAINNQIQVYMSNYGLKVNSLTINLDEDTESETCGKIKGITLVASVKEEENKEETKSIAPIDQVTIDKVTINQDTSVNQYDKASESPNKDQYDTVLELNIKQELVALYGVPIEQVSVTIHKG